MKTIDLLENHELYNYNQYFENAYLYLKKSTNLFKALNFAKEKFNTLDVIEIQKKVFEKWLRTQNNS